MKLVGLFQANNGGRWIAEISVGTVRTQHVVADYRATEAQARARCAKLLGVQP